MAACIPRLNWPHPSRCQKDPIGRDIHQSPSSDNLFFSLASHVRGNFIHDGTQPMPWNVLAVLGPKGPRTALPSPVLHVRPYPTSGGNVTCDRPRGFCHCRPGESWPRRKGISKCNRSSIWRYQILPPVQIDIRVIHTQIHRDGEEGIWASRLRRHAINGRACSRV